MSGEYPTDDELAQIKGWDMKDPLGWFAFIRSVWWMPEWGWSEGKNEDGDARFEISTGGWSGNEDIIGAMEGTLLWFFTWMSSRRGGHYVFEVPDGLADQPVRGGTEG